MPVKANIFSSRPYAFLAEKIAAAPSEIDFRLGKIEHTRFPDGENYYRLLEAREIRNSPAVYVAGTVSDAAVMEMYNICSALVMEQCSSLHIVIYNHPASGYVGIQGNNLRLLAGKTLFHNISAVQPQTAAHFLHPFRPPHVGRSQNRVFTDISNHLSYQRFGGQMNRTDGTFKVILGAE